MKCTGDSPVYKLKDERYFLALCRQNLDNRYIDIYFVNNSAEGIVSLRMRVVEYCYKANIKDIEQESYVEGWFYDIPSKGYTFLTRIDNICDKPGEYISSYEIMTGSEKVIAECTIYKDTVLIGSYDKSIPVIETEGKRVFLESRTFST